MRDDSPGSGRSPFGKFLRIVLGAVVVVAATGAASHSMGLWQYGTTATPVTTRPIGKPVAVRGQTVTLLAAGSVLPTLETWDQARRDGGAALNFGPMLAGTRRAASGADLALCHLSTPLANAGGPRSGPPRYSAPPEVAQAIADAGFDGCATAAKHALDQGLPGVKHTLEALDAADLGHAGTYADAAQAERPRIYTAGEIKVGHLSYLLGGSNQKAGADQPWSLAQASAGRIRKDARAARRAGAEIVVVSVEWGTGGEHEPDVSQQTLARAVAEMTDVDIVLGHGAHVVQPIERIGDKWIVYGLGDLLSRHPQPIGDNREGSMIRVTFSPADESGRWTVAALEALPTFIDLNPDIRTVDLEQALADPTISPGHRRIYEAATTRIESHLLNRGGSGSVLRIRTRDS